MADSPPGGTGLLLPLTTALLAYQRLGDIADQLDRKVRGTRVSPGSGSGAAPVQVRALERRVLALASTARTWMQEGGAAPVPHRLPGAGIGSYALLGALGFEIPTYTSLLAPGGSWVADMLRRGTPDPNRSLVAVPAVELPLALGRIAATAAAAAQPAMRAFSLGMLSAAASGVLVGPQMADLLVRDTNRDWSRHTPSRGAAAVERYLRRRFLGGDDRVSPVPGWLPAAGTVPAQLWDGYVRALTDTFGTQDRRVRGFAAFEKDFVSGDPLRGVRLRNAYGLLLDDVRTSSWHWAVWWLLSIPVLIGPSMGILAARGLPNAGAFFTEGATITERSVFELLFMSMGVSSAVPFIYSMIMWSAVDEHTEAFVNALLMFFTRAGLVIPGLVRSAGTQQTDVERWLLFTALAGIDVYALVRAAVAGSNRPGVATVFGLQTIPLASGLVALLVAGILKAANISHDWRFWLVWGLFTGAMVGVGIPVGFAFAGGGGWRSWF